MTATLGNERLESPLPPLSVFDESTEPIPDMDSKPQLFVDQFAVSWGRVKRGDHYENLALRGKPFRNWLIRGMLDRGERPNRSRIAEQLDTFEALADLERRQLHNRSAWSENGTDLYIDLVDSSWRVVRVSPSGWVVEITSPVFFRRFVHQMALPEPDPSGDLHDLVAFLPPLRSDIDRLLVLTYLVAALVPMPRPILMPLGPQGSAKSTFSALLRRLVDPSRAELLGRDSRADLVQTFYRHAVPVFDNADTFTPQEADLFCQAITGRAIDRRRLYTDGDEYLLSFLRPIIVNGLCPPTNRPDFLDRSLIIDLDRLTPDQRRTLGNLEAEFVQAHSRLFGGLLNILVHTLKLLPTISDNGLSRMADFHRFGRAAAIALGSTSDAFDAAMKEAETRQRRDATDSPLAAALLLFARKQRRWEGEPTALLERLADTARAHQIRRSAEGWPDTPIDLGRQLTQLSAVLAEHGVTITRPRKANARLVRLVYEPDGDPGETL